MKHTNTFTLKDTKYNLLYFNEKREILIEKNNEEILRFEDRKDLFYFVNQLTDYAEKIKEIEDGV